MAAKKPKALKPAVVALRIRRQPNFIPPCATVWFLQQDGAALSQIGWGEVLIDRVAPLIAWAKEKGIEVELADDLTDGEPAELVMVPVGQS